ncbi:MAG: DUF4349 domain-containing protein [Bacillota bacterium]
MKCAEARALLSEYIDGTLEGDDRALLEGHLAGCAECSRELEMLRAQVAWCSSLGEVPLPGDFHAQLMQRIGSLAAQSSTAGSGKMQWRFTDWLQRHRAVASVLVVFALAFALSRITPLIGTKDSTRQMAQKAAETSSLSVKAPARVGVAYDMVTQEAKPAYGEAGSVNFPAGIVAVGDPTVASRRLIKHGSLNMEVPSGGLETAARAVQSIVQGVGGYIENSSSSVDAGGRGTMHFAVRVPSDQFDSVFGQLAKVGKVLNQNVSASDVTEQFIDLQAQLRNKERQEQRLLELMGKAATVGELLQVENELNRIRTEIDSLKQRLKYLENATSMSTISITLVEAKIGLPFAGGIIEAAWQAFVRAAQSVAIVIASLLPYAAAIALIWWAVAAGLRYRRKG